MSISVPLPELVVLGAVFVVSSLFLVIPAARICHRVGFSMWLGVIAVVPLANVILLWFVAFSDWPRWPVRPVTPDGEPVQG
jgi:hypothetical protein